MKEQLSLRQHKILRLLRNRTTCMTSEEIAGSLNVSSKTVRADISDINFALSGEGIHIDSIKSKGFILNAENPGLLKTLTKDANIFLSRSDRIFYLAHLLCTTDKPLDLYDLEDTLAVSSSTLTGDLAAFKKRFVQDVPYIETMIVKDTIALEENERKKRFILTKTLCDNWDYSSTGNAYYGSDIIDSDAFRIINAVAGKTLFRFGIILSDYNLIFLVIYLTITYNRLLEGHALNEALSPLSDNPAVSDACRELFTALEDKLGFHFPDEEIYETERIVAESSSTYVSFISDPGIMDKYKDIADRYLQRIYDTFAIDLKDDADFYQRLLSFISQLFKPMKDLTVKDTPSNIKNHLFVEHDVALLFHKIAEKECPITENDLLYLTMAVYGAFFNHFSRHPEAKFNTVVLCHMGEQTMWSLKLSLQNMFGGYLNIKDIIPVHHKDYYDFSDVRLLLSTVENKYPAGYDKNIISISPYLSRDNSFDILTEIRNLKIQDLYPKKIHTISSLLDNAFVHEKGSFTSQYSIVEYMCKDFLENGIFEQEHMFSILKRESISTFAFAPAVLLLFSTTPAAETRMSVLTLDHRIIWNKLKIRIVFMVSFTKEDMRELFYLQNIIYHRKYDPETLKHFKTLDEIKEFYKDY